MSRRIVQRTLVGAAVCAVAVGGLGGTASAGEITGNGEYRQPLKGKSECSYSGQNDGYHDPSQVDPRDPQDATRRTQSYGQIVRLLGPNPLPFNPGQACNPTFIPPEGME